MDPIQDKPLRRPEDIGHWVLIIPFAVVAVLVIIAVTIVLVQ